MAAVILGSDCLHATGCRPCACIDEEIRIVFQGRLGQIELEVVAAVPGILERATWGGWTLRQDCFPRSRGDVISEDVEGTDVLVKEDLSHFLLVCWKKTLGFKLLTGNPECTRASSTDHFLISLGGIDVNGRRVVKALSVFPSRNTAQDC